MPTKLSRRSSLQPPGGYAQPEKLEADAAWSPLRSDPRYAELLERGPPQSGSLQILTREPPVDFWVGDWDVVSTADGHPVGTSHIARELSDCVIWENRTSANLPYASKSYNVYNANLKRWEQFWVDNSAGTIFFHGNLKDGVMDYWTEDIPQSGGSNLRRHLQFFNIGPDTVRQFSQQSTDGGKTWTVEYDFTYRRKS